MRTFTITRPPSVNRLYRVVRNRKTGKGGIARTEAYELWLSVAGWEMKSQGRWEPVMTGRVSVTVVVNTVGDIDNILKATLDLLQKMDVITNDRNVKCILVEQADDADPKTITITVEERKNAEVAVE